MKDFGSVEPAVLVAARLAGEIIAQFGIAAQKLGSPFNATAPTGIVSLVSVRPLRSAISVAS